MLILTVALLSFYFINVASYAPELDPIFKEEAWVSQGNVWISAAPKLKKKLQRQWTCCTALTAEISGRRFIPPPSSLADEQHSPPVENPVTFLSTLKIHQQHLYKQILCKSYLLGVQLKLPEYLVAPTNVSSPSLQSTCHRRLVVFLIFGLHWIRTGVVILRAGY
ncbi:hypothetical protein WG66_010248 [Moniliophthora roreri]|nr:hypothetical protein WG66_010248 [Moniliophthora roreri]